MNFSSLRFELKQYPIHYLILAIILALAFFVRVYRQDDLLRFYYDQGRDALVIKEMLETPKPVLVGPTTGLAGILRGPAFYYLLAPAYLIGQGNPVIAAYWLQILNVFGLIFIYLTARLLYGRTAGILAVILVGLSNQVVDLSRWLSNPSPILWSVPLMVLGLVKIKKGSRPNFWWPVVALMLGLNLQFEIASEIWFIPAVVFLALIDKDMRPSWRVAIISFLFFLATLLPQVIFDLRHDGIMRAGITAHFAGGGPPAFTYNSKLFGARWHLFTDTYVALLEPQNYALVKVMVLLTALLWSFPAFRKNSQILLILLAFPVVILSFYQGNEGNFYGYYLIGTFPIFLLLLAGGLAWYWRQPALRLLPLLFLTFFLWKNGVLLKNFLSAGTDGRWGSEHISLANQLLAIDWIYADAGGRPFNTDIYVPPVIPYAYDYLIPWRGENKFGQAPVNDRVPLLYTLYEVDPSHPYQLAMWLLRQGGIAEVQEYKQYGGIVVQRRLRK